MLTITEKPAGAAERRFFAGIAFAALVIVFAGFAKSYYLWPVTRATHFAGGQPISPSLPIIVHLHAIGFSGWIVLLAMQGPHRSGRCGDASTAGSRGSCRSWC